MLKVPFKKFFFMSLLAGAHLQLSAIDILPKANSIKKLETEAFTINEATSIRFDGRLRNEAYALAKALSEKTGFKIKTYREELLIVLPSEIYLDFSKEEAPKESYSIAVKDKQIKVISSDKAGAFYAGQSLIQLTPKATPFQIPALEIQDAPRFGWRGYMLDSSRTFWEMDEVKKVLDTLAYFKINTFHMHLTDNDGWRLEIKKFPKLTTIGAEGNHRDRKAPRKFYTQDQIKELIAYAKARHIQIIPEIDMPGHAAAALRAYPEFGVGGGTFNPSNPATMQFLKDILKETAELFESPYIHFGGDEVSTKNWDKDPFIQKQMKELGLTNPKDIEHHFVKEISNYIENLGKTVVGWGEINDQGAASQNAVIMCWRDRGMKAAERAVKEGKRMVFSPQVPLYFDWSYGANSTRKVYNYNPTAFITDKSKEELVLGVQANLWTEQTPNTEKMHGLTFPRLLALAETGWTEQSNKSWDEFHKRLKKQQVWLKENGISYYDEVGQNEKDFDPKVDVPSAVRPSKLTTSLPQYYKLAYAFDGRVKSYFWSARGPKKDDFILLSLNEPALVKSVKALTGDLGKDALKEGILEISLDGKEFKKVADFENGNAEYSFPNKTSIKAVRIKATANQGAWMTLKEIILEQ